jgi:hypothetical protein
MHDALIIVSIAGGFGAGILCWKCTESWRIGARPGPTEGNARYKRIELISVWCSIGAFFVGMFAVAQIVLLLH